MRRGLVLFIYLSLEQLGFTTKLKEVYLDFSYTLSHTCTASPININIPHQNYSVDTPHSILCITQTPEFTLRFTVSAMHSMRLDKCIMYTCIIHHFSLIQCSFSVLKNPCESTYSSSHPTPAQPHLFTKSIVLPFPECYTVRNHVQYIKLLFQIGFIHLVICI